MWQRSLLMLQLCSTVLSYAPPQVVPVPQTVPNGVSADCSTGHLEVDCQVTGLPVIDNIGFDAAIDTAALEINVDILYDGKSYSIYHLSAHNPELCISEIAVAKVCAKVEDLQWGGGEVSGTLYVGVGVVLVGTKYFKVTDFDFDYDEVEEAAADAAEAKALDDANSVCSICEEAVSALIGTGAGSACGAACAATGCEPCVPFCASICAAIASGETDAEAICSDIDLC